jgi:hypothetical protein
MTNAHLTGDTAGHTRTRCISTETKASYRTTEFVLYILARSAS